jgi:hypothetical protein
VKSHTPLTHPSTPTLTRSGTYATYAAKSRALKQYPRVRHTRMHTMAAAAAPPAEVEEEEDEEEPVDPPSPEPDPPPPTPPPPPPPPPVELDEEEFVEEALGSRVATPTREEEVRVEKVGGAR